MHSTHSHIFLVFYHILIILDRLLHVFPEKKLALEEIFRVLKDGGIFCGSCYIFGENNRTDFFVKNFCERFNFFTQPFETAESLQKKLGEFYSEIKISTVQSFAEFICKK